MFSLDFVGYQVAFNRWAVPLNVDVDRLHPGRFQLYVSLLCLHLAFSVGVPGRMPKRKLRHG